MKKRWLSTALCVAMAAGTLAGCGLKTPETTTAAPATTEAAKEETKAEEKLKRPQQQRVRQRQRQQLPASMTLQICLR